MTEGKNLVKEKDFIEIDFVGRVKDGEIFDSTKKEDLEKIHTGHNHPIESKPLTFCVGTEMFLKSLDDFLVGKEVGKEYEVELPPEKAFGKRDPSSVQRIPSKVFKEQRVNPSPGAVFNFDGRIGKILTVSGGRVVVDFNHYLAGKDVEYKIKILRKIDNLNEKIKSLNEFFLKKDFEFEVKGKKIIIDIDKSLERLVELFSDKYKEIIGMDIEVKGKSSEKPEQEDKVKKSKPENNYNVSSKKISEGKDKK